MENVKHAIMQNGATTVNMMTKAPYRDTANHTLEERWGDVLIQFYEASDIIRQEREAREEAARKREEAEQRRGERRKRYNLEVATTIRLVNEANDYQTAPKIRLYISAVEKNLVSDDDMKEWIKWAKKKADWYDPTIACDDIFFGKRAHKKDSEEKGLKKRGSYWEW